MWHWPYIQPCCCVLLRWHDYTQPTLLQIRLGRGPTIKLQRVSHTFRLRKGQLRKARGEKIQGQENRRLIKEAEREREARDRWCTGKWDGGRENESGVGERESEREREIGGRGTYSALHVNPNPRTHTGARWEARAYMRARSPTAYTLFSHMWRHVHSSPLFPLSSREAPGSRTHHRRSVLLRSAPDPVRISG